MNIVTAFAVICQRIIFQEYDSDEHWLSSLRDTGFSDEDEDDWGDEQDEDFEDALDDLEDF